MNKTHLVLRGTKLFVDPLDEVEGWDYWSKRLKFWEWKLHRSIARPFLMKRKETQ